MSEATTADQIARIAIIAADYGVPVWSEVWTGPGSSEWLRLSLAQRSELIAAAFEERMRVKSR